MFTGIVECMGRVAEWTWLDGGEGGGGGVSMVVGEAGPVLGDVHLGDSIAVNGVCLTVTTFHAHAGTFKVGIAPETLRKTCLSRLRPGQQVNLERALAAGARFGGHFVQGHVDTTVTLVGRRVDPPNSLVLELQVPEPGCPGLGCLPAGPPPSAAAADPPADGKTANATPSEGPASPLAPECIPPRTDYLAYLVPKGYVTLDGTSLTIIDVDRPRRTFTVMLIAHTQAHVTLPQREVGEPINLEVDQMGKYVESTVLAMFGGRYESIDRIREVLARL